MYFIIYFLKLFDSSVVLFQLFVCRSLITHIYWTGSKLGPKWLFSKTECNWRHLSVRMRLGGKKGGFRSASVWYWVDPLDPVLCFVPTSFSPFVAMWKWHWFGLLQRLCFLTGKANAALPFGKLTVGDAGGLLWASVIAGCKTVCKRCTGLEYVKCFTHPGYFRVLQDYSVHAKVLCKLIFLIAVA